MVLKYARQIGKWLRIQKRRAFIKLSVLINVLLGLLFVISIFPVIVDEHYGVNTSLWNFTGYSGASTLWGLIPFIILAVFIIGRLAKRN